MSVIRRALRRLAGEERGAFLALFVVIGGAALLIMAIAFNVGNWLEHRRHLQNQVDAGVLATARDFSFCFAAPDAANAAIQAAARKYAGDPAVIDSVNPQVGDPDRVSMVLNGTDWPPTGIDAYTPVADPARMPCTLKSLEIKAKDQGIPSLLAAIVPRDTLDVRARARVEIRKIIEMKGMLPFAIPEFDPKAIGVLFVDESNGTVVGRSLLVKDPTKVTKNGTSVTIWDADVQTDVVGRTGTVVVQSTIANPDLSGGTVAEVCDNPKVICRAGNTATSGLGYIHGYTTAGTGTASTPILRDAYMDNLDCNADGSPPAGSAPYYLHTAGCHVRVRAKIDFGTGAGNPTVSPTLARVWVQGLGCPTNGGNNGCPMTWNAGTGFFESNTAPFVANDSGRNTVSLFWQTGSSSGGPAPLAAVRKAPAAGLYVNPKLAALVVPNARRSATKAVHSARRTLAGSANGTLTVRKLVPAGPNVASDWTIQVRNGNTNALIQSFAGSPGGTPVVVPRGVPIIVREIPGPNVTFPHTMTAGGDCTKANATDATVTIPTSGNANRNCNLTNTFDGATLTVRKALVNGADPASAFTMTVKQGATTVASFPGSTAGTTIYVNPGAYTVTETGGSITYTVSYTGCPAGAVTLAAHAVVTCTVTNSGPAPPQPSSNTFTNVLHPYAQNDAAGLVNFLQITKLGVVDAGSLQTGTAQIVHVYVGVEPSLETGLATDPPILLRLTIGSQNQTVDCDKNRTLNEEIQTGCLTPYHINEQNDSCVPYDGPGQLPPGTTTPNPTPQCAATQTGGSLGNLRKGFHDRFESPCTPNLWPTDNNDPLPTKDDPRWVVLFVTDATSFSGSGNDQFPIRKFAAFYVTGWDTGGQANGCPGNDPSPNPGSDDGNVWGHFVTQVIFDPSPTESTEVCDFSEVGICKAILVE